MSDDELREEITSKYYRDNIFYILIFSIILSVAFELHYGFYAFTLACLGMYIFKNDHIESELSKIKNKEDPSCEN